MLDMVACAGVGSDTATTAIPVSDGAIKPELSRPADPFKAPGHPDLGGGVQFEQDVVGRSDDTIMTAADEPVFCRKVRSLLGYGKPPGCSRRASHRELHLRVEWVGLQIRIPAI